MAYIASPRYWSTSTLSYLYWELVFYGSKGERGYVASMHGYKNTRLHDTRMLGIWPYVN